MSVKLEGGHRRPLSPLADVVIHDTEEGVEIVIDNRDQRPYTLRFDFGASDNLAIETRGGTEPAGPMKCNLVVQPGTAAELCALTIVDMDKEAFDMRYRVQCFAPNEKGELEEIRPGGGGGGGGGAAPSGEETRTEIGEDVAIVARKTPDATVLFVENGRPGTVSVTIDCTASLGCAMQLAPEAQSPEPMVCKASAPTRTRNAVARLVAEGGDEPLPLFTASVDGEEDTGAVVVPPAAAPTAAAPSGAVDHKLRGLLFQLQKEEVEARMALQKEFTKDFIGIEAKRRFVMCNLCRALFKPTERPVTYKTYRLHQVCYDNAKKCDQCGEILIGDYVVSKGVEGREGIALHKACIDAYKKASRPTCCVCKQQIMEEKWASKGGEACHVACA